MSTIKIKNSASSSAPTSLEVGELALGTLNGSEKIFFKNSAGNIITINDWTKILNKPASFPASDVYSWAKASTKPTYTYSEVGAASSTHTHNYLALTGGTLSGSLTPATTATYDLGTSSLKWNNIYSNSFIGNASTATQLQTARNIAGVSFNGTTDIAIPFNNLISKPTTLAGYGITDSVNISGSQTITGAKTFQNVSGITLSNGTKSVNLSVDSDGKLKIDNDLYSTGEISAYNSGTGSTGGTSGLISSVYGTAGFGGTYSSSDYTNTFNAYAINSLYNSTASNTSSISTLNSTVNSLSSTVSTLNSNVSSLSSTVASLSGGSTSFSGTYYNSSSGKYLYYGGYTIFPNGLIMQWGQMQGDDGTYSFPYTFPNKCLSIQITTNRTSSGSNGTNHAGNVTNSSFYAVLDASTGWMLAIGY